MSVRTRRAISGKTARLLRRYEDDLHLRYGERTAPEYLRHVEDFVHWLAQRGEDLTHARGEDLHAYQSALYAARKKSGDPYSLGHQINRLKAIKSLFRFLYRRHYVLHDLAAALEMPRQDKRLPRTILSEAEARRIMEAPSGRRPDELRDRAILETFYATGIRVTELIMLKPSDIDLDERSLRVLLGKGRRDRHVPITTAAARAIRAYLRLGRPKLVVRHAPPSVLLFLANRGNRLHRGTLSDIVAHWVKKAGVKKHVSCHTFRHSVATHLLRRRADIRHIQMLLGHENLSSTERYTRVALRDLREVLRRAHPRG